MGEKVSTYLGSLIQLFVGREWHCIQIALACVGSAHSRWTTLGLPQPKVVCTSQVHTSQAPGCSARALSQVGPVFHALTRFRPLRFSGAQQGHRPRWTVHFVPFSVLSSSGDQMLGECTVPGGSWILIISLVLDTQIPRCAVCLLWGDDFRLWHSWQMSIVQDTRKMRLATEKVLIVWYNMRSLGPILKQSLTFQLWLFQACLSVSGEEGSYMSAGLLCFGNLSIFYSVSTPGISARC